LAERKLPPFTNEPAALDQDLSLNYIERIREYYQVLGYGEPYQWARFDSVPFTPLKKPLAQSTVGIVTTAAPCRADAGEQGPGAAYNGSAKFFSVYSDATASEPDLRISHIGYDRAHTTAKDQGI
jgi:D-proline reductase (dithiol) PrdB